MRYTKAVSRLTRLVLVVLVVALGSCGDDPTPPKQTPVVELISIPAGTFMQGDTLIEFPVHQSTITQPILAGRTEVTQILWRTVMGTLPVDQVAIGDSLPVHNVNWIECVEFCNQLSEKQGLQRVYTKAADGFYRADFTKTGYRLPTESEWEWMCRAGTTTDYYTGNSTQQDLDSNFGIAGWYEKNSGGSPQNVGLKVPNAFGLVDMHGNVWEWTNNWFSWYSAAPRTDYRGPDTAIPRRSWKIQRGGSFFPMGRIHYGTSSHRHSTDPEVRHPSFGLRVVRNRP